MRDCSRRAAAAVRFAMLVLVLAASGMGARAAERAMAIDESVHGIEFAGRGTVIVARGDQPGLRMEAQSNALLERYAVSERDGTLVIERHGGRSLWKRLFGREDEADILVEITLAAAERVAFAGSGELLLTGVRGERLEVALSGAGECRLSELEVEDLLLTISGAGACAASGSAVRQRVRISGAGDFDGAELASRSVHVTLSGAADASFQVSDELDATVSGAGSIAYRGRPTVRQQISGFGSISRVH